MTQNKKQRWEGLYRYFSISPPVHSAADAEWWHNLSSILRDREVTSPLPWLFRDPPREGEQEQLCLPRLLWEGLEGGEALLSLPTVFSPEGNSWGP